MKIQIFSDFMCPYCYIGLVPLLEAIDELKIRPEIVFCAFELNEDLESTGKLFTQNMKEKHDLNNFEVKATVNRMEKYAKEVGLDYNLEKAIAANTNLAHRLMKFAEENNKALELEIELMKAVFIEGLDIGKIDVLKSIAKRVELDTSDIEKYLELGSTKALVLEDKNIAHALKINVVPSYRIDEDEIVEGTMEKDEWINKLKQYM